jgi:hypothetical protein
MAGWQAHINGPLFCPNVPYRGPGAKTAGGGVVRNVLNAVLAWLAIWNCRARAAGY